MLDSLVDQIKHREETRVSSNFHIESYLSPLDQIRWAGDGQSDSEHLLYLDKYVTALTVSYMQGVWAIVTIVTIEISIYAY